MKEGVAYNEVKRLFREAPAKGFNKGQSTSIEQKIRELTEQIEEWQREFEKIFREEMKPLVIEAEATVFKRTDEVRNKIVALSLDEIIADEERILKEYREFMSRADIGRLKEEYPKVVELKEEPLVLLRLAWAKKEVKDRSFKLSPDEWRQREINRLLTKARDSIAARQAAFKVEIQEKIEAIELKKEMERLIDERGDLTPEEKAEIKAAISQSEQVLMSKDEKPAEVI